MNFYNALQRMREIKFYTWRLSETYRDIWLGTDIWDRLNVEYKKQ